MEGESSWERYLALDVALGVDRLGPRFYCLNGELKIMTTSNEHERIKKWIGDLMAVYFEEAGIALLERCVAIRSWQEARRTFRAGLAAALDPL